jgi:hypothetical protein
VVWKAGKGWGWADRGETAGSRLVGETWIVVRGGGRDEGEMHQGERGGRVDGVDGVE